MGRCTAAHRDRDRRGRVMRPVDLVIIGMLMVIGGQASARGDKESVQDAAGLVVVIGVVLQIVGGLWLGLTWA